METQSPGKRKHDSPLGAIVTGGASGIGRAAAHRLASDGFAVAVLDQDEKAARSVAEQIRAAGGSAVARLVDVGSPAKVESAFASAAGEIGAVSVLVNSAGIIHTSPVLELSVEDWNRVLKVDLTGTFLCCQAGAKLMMRIARQPEETGGGRIVNIASVHSLAPGRGLAHYDAAKGGVWMLTKNLALELAPHGITVNAVGPGLILTNLAGGPNDEYLSQVVPTIPLGRPGQPEDVAGPISFLCSPDASYITGAMLFVDGGMLLTTKT